MNKELINYKTWEKSVKKVLSKNFIQDVTREFFDHIKKGTVENILSETLEYEGISIILKHKDNINSVLLSGEDLKKWATFPEVHNFILAAAYLTSEFFTEVGLDEDKYKETVYSTAMKLCLYSVLADSLEGVLASVEGLRNAIDFSEES